MSDIPSEKEKSGETVPETDIDNAAPDTTKAPMPREIGGRKGPEPTRYGDWEKKGIISDF